MSSSETTGRPGAHEAWTPAIHEDGRTEERTVIQPTRADDRVDGRADGRADGRGERRAVVDREKDRYGGIKVGSAFFGWLTATGTAVLLTAVVAAVGAAVGFSMNTGPGQATSGAEQVPQTVGIAGAITALVIVLIAYYCGGYVAGRMARFNGAKQGLTVWLWGLVIAILVAVAAAVAGSQFDVLSQINGLPRLPIDGGTLTAVGLIAALATAAVSLLGAILGGLAGMRFHRKVDKAGLER